MKKLLQNLYNKIADLFSRLTPRQRNAAHRALEITKLLRDALDSGVAEIVIPEKWQDERETVVLHLSAAIKLIMGLNDGDKSNDMEYIVSFMEFLKSQNGVFRNAILQKLAALLLNHINNMELAENEAQAITDGLLHYKKYYN